MLLSKSVALSILSALAVDALVIPDITIDVFGDSKAGLQKLKEGTKAQIEGQDLSGLVSELEDKISEGLDNLKDSAKQGLDAVKQELAPLFSSGKDVIAGKYIVVYKDAAHEDAESHELAINSHADGTILDKFKIDGLLGGYIGHFSEEVIKKIRSDPLVKFVEQDSVVRTSEFNVQKGAPWGLARVSHREPLSLNSFNQYLYDNNAGKGVTSYIIDTGVNVKHEDFGGRAKWGKTVPEGDEDVDGNGHGTHCAGTIGSKSYGVAKNADLVAVKVLRSNGSGSMSDVVKGVEFAANAHQKAVKANKKGFKGSTANMSLGGGKSPALDLAVNAAVNAGIHFAVAAGNENQDACNSSPAAAENAITVGASTLSDARAYFSNYGKCVDIFAPGLNILSTYIGSDSATATLSGTSMASPHIAGLLSYFLSLQPASSSEFFTSAKGVTPKQLKKNLIAYGSKNILTDIPADTPNILAFNGAGHNITDFWREETSEVSSKSSKSKFASTLEDIETNVEELFQDLKEIGLNLI